jgi:hypothetical protein
MHVILYSSITSKRAINSKYNMALLERLNDEIKKKTAHLKKKSAVSLRQCSVSPMNHNDGKIELIRLRIAFPSTVFSRSALQWRFLFADLKRLLAGKIFSTNEEKITENEAFFEASNGIKMVSKNCMTAIIKSLYRTRKELYWILRILP